MKLTNDEAKEQVTQFCNTNGFEIKQNGKLIKITSSGGIIITTAYSWTKAWKNLQRLEKNSQT